MIRSGFIGGGLCLVLTFGCFTPVVLLAQQPPPSITLRYDTGEPGQIGATIRNLGPGPSIVDGLPFAQGQLIQPLNLVSPFPPVVEPLYDPEEFPNGPMRVTLMYPEVTLPTNCTIIPGFVGTVLPARLGATLTPEEFLASYLADYILEVNGFRFMDSNLLTPAHIVRLGPINNQIVPTLPSGDFYIFGLNITMRFDAPGTHRIRNIMRIPKTILIPELNATFFAGQFINEITVHIAAPGSEATHAQNSSQ